MMFKMAFKVTSDLSEENENIQFQLTDELIEQVELLVEEQNARN
jgi:hypothetical protein